MKVMVDPAFPDHRKVAAVAEALKVDEGAAVGYVLTLWCRAMSLAPTGHLEGWTDVYIARSAKWPKSPASFVKAMISSGLLVGQAGGRSIKDWVDWQGDIIKKREEWAKRKAVSRESRGSHAGQNGDSRGSLKGVSTSVPSPSLPSPSVPSPAIPAPPAGEAAASAPVGVADAPRQPGGTLDVLAGALNKANGTAAKPATPAEPPEARSEAIQAAYDLAKTLGGPSGEALARYVGFLENREGVPSKAILDGTRKLFNHRQGMPIQMGDKVPFDRIFAYGIDQAIQHDAVGVSYVGKVCQAEYMRIRDGCGRA